MIGVGKSVNRMCDHDNGQVLRSGQAVGTEDLCEDMFVCHWVKPAEGVI